MDATNDHHDTDNISLLEELTKGERLTVYWSDDDQWYEGKATSAPQDHRVRVQYDDGGKAQWVDLTTTQWSSLGKGLILEQEAQAAMNLKRERIQNIQVGTKVAVFWPHEKDFFAGTLTKIKPTSDLSLKNNPHRIEYDDGDSEWTNLYHRKFKQVKPKALRLRVGSRIFVRNPEKGRNYGATVTRIKLGEARPHKVKYDKERKGEEWLNLYVHPFLEKPPRIKVDPDLSSKSPVVLKKRKREFLQDMPESAIGKGWKVKKEEPAGPHGKDSLASIKRDTAELERTTFELVRCLSAASKGGIDKKGLASRILKHVDPNSEILGSIMKSLGDVKAPPNDP